MKELGQELGNEERGVMFRPEFVALTQGDVLAALVLSQILYWYGPDKYGKSKLQVYKHGRWWLAKSTKDWEQELGISQKQARRCIAVLQELGFIETMLLRFDGAPVVHLRFVFVTGRQLLNCPNELIHLTSGKVPFAPQGKFLTETTTETTTENGIMNADDILKKHQAKKQAEKTAPLPALTKSVTPGRLAMVWKKRLASEGGFVKDLTAKEMGQLKHVISGLGDLSYTTLDWALQNWPAFVNGVRQAKGIQSVPEKPDVGFFCKYYDIAATIRSAQLIAPTVHVPISQVTKKAPHSAPAPVAPPVASDVKLASSEDVQASLQELLALKEAPK